MFCFLAVYAAFEHFVFASRHDFFMADFLPFFSVTPIKSIFFYCKDGGELLFYFSLAILDLERQIEESKFPLTILEMFFCLYISSGKACIKKK